ncbi:acyl carrier protein [Zoogloea sp.]|uniref:acyl carrier protein n=1 Tax=Zoogloea sp. TaxID=49181 RepID=UPI00260DDA81|nr:acyl carrier protein [Zoogloea sp.]MDD3355241.1 acyl carrier protein [Zoogloea sp.]
MTHNDNPYWSLLLDTKKEVLAILDEVLSLGGAAAQFDLDTALLGSLPDLDSMAVVGVINLFEERFDIVVEDDEIDGSTFVTVGSLVDFINGKLA